MSRRQPCRARARIAVPSVALVGVLALVAPTWIERFAGAEPPRPSALDAASYDTADRVPPLHLLQGIEIRVDALRDERSRAERRAPVTAGEEPETLPLPRSFDSRKHNK